MVNKHLAWKAFNQARPVALTCNYSTPTPPHQITPLLRRYMNRNHHVYYSMLFGDKDTFRFAWKALAQPYHLVRWVAAEVGYTTDQEKQFCGHTLGHHDPDGNILFLHTHLLKASSASLLMARNEMKRRHARGGVLLRARACFIRVVGG